MDSRKLCQQLEARLAEDGFFEEGSPEWGELVRFLALNAKQHNPKNLCVDCWALLSKYATQAHRAKCGRVLTPAYFKAEKTFRALTAEAGRVKLVHGRTYI